MTQKRYGTPREGSSQTARQTSRNERTGRATRDARQSKGRGWPQLLVAVGVIALIIVGVVLMLRPVQHVQKSIYPVEYRDAILESCERHNVSPHLVCAIIKCESGWREDVVSGVGAVGLMQVMPSTASSLVGLGYVDEAAYPSENLADPLINIEYGCATLDFLQHQFDTEEEVIAAYNAGVGTVQNWLAASGGANFRDCITYPETLAYLTRVEDAVANYRELYDDKLNPRD